LRGHTRETTLDGIDLEGQMKLHVWTSPLAVALQFAFSAAPHPYGLPHKQAAPLFAPRATFPQTSAEPTSKIVCGTLLVEANPKLDPRMTLEPRTDIAFAIRTYPRPSCGKAK
jgi:hypothetical protein